MQTSNCVNCAILRTLRITSLVHPSAWWLVVQQVSRWHLCKRASCSSCAAAVTVLRATPHSAGVHVLLMCSPSSQCCPHSARDTVLPLAVLLLVLLSLTVLSPSTFYTVLCYSATTLSTAPVSYGGRC